MTDKEMKDRYVQRIIEGLALIKSGVDGLKRNYFDESEVSDIEALGQTLTHVTLRWNEKPARRRTKVNA